MRGAVSIQYDPTFREELSQFFSEKVVLVQSDGVERVYMITDVATEEYKERTGHDWMPRLFEETDEKI